MHWFVGHISMIVCCYFRSAAVKVMTLLMLPVADTRVSRRLTAAGLSRSGRWRSMTGGLAAANGIAIFSIAAQGSADKNRSWEKSLSRGTAYVIDWFIFEITRFDPHVFRLLLFSLSKSSTPHETPWASVGSLLFLLTHKIIHVSTHTTKSKDV